MGTKKVFAVFTVFTIFFITVTSCSKNMTSGAMKQQELKSEDVKSGDVTEKASEPTITNTPNKIPTVTPKPSLNPTITPTLTSTKKPTQDWGSRYWTEEEAYVMLTDVQGFFAQFFMDPSLPDKDDNFLPYFTLTILELVEMDEEEVEGYYTYVEEYAEELSLIPADYICNRMYLWFTQGYGWDVVREDFPDSLELTYVFWILSTIGILFQIP